MTNTIAYIDAANLHEGMKMTGMIEKRAYVKNEKAPDTDKTVAGSLSS